MSELMMVSQAQHEALRRLLTESMSFSGDVVEAGCNTGSTSALLAEWLQASGRELHLYDSFEGLPDESGFGGLMRADQQELESSICSQLDQPDLPSFIHIHAGWFVNTMPAQLPSRISFAFVDCDVFESMMDSVPPIIERLTGVLVLHDYTHERWGSGVQRAVESMCLSVNVVEGMAIIRGTRC